MSDHGWGILGSAKIARRAVIPAILQCPNAELVAVASVDEARRAEIQALHQGLRVYSDYQGLLESSEIRFVYIPLPNSLHTEWTLKALQRGKHVLCEKPMAMHASEFDQLREIAERSNRHLGEALMSLHHPQWQRVRSLLASGVVGKLKSVHSEFSFKNVDPNDIRNQAATGGGALRDLGVYPIALTRFATGCEKLAHVDTVDAIWEVVNGVDASCNARISFVDFTLRIEVSLRRSPKQAMEFHGDAGRLRLTSPFTVGRDRKTEIEVKLISGEEWIEEFEFVDQYALMIQAFMDEAKTKRAPAASLEFSRVNQSIVDWLIATRI